MAWCFKAAVVPAAVNEAREGGGTTSAMSAINFGSVTPLSQMLQKLEMMLSLSIALLSLNAFVLCCTSSSVELYETGSEISFHRPGASCQASNLDCASIGYSHMGF